MGLVLDIEAVDLKTFNRFMTRKVAKQVAFGTSLGLNKFGKALQIDERKRVGRVLIIRNAWVQRGITFKPSNKKQEPYPFVEIGYRDDFMTLQETGGIKKPRGRSIAVPVESPSAGAGVRRTPQSRITKKKRPRILLSDPKGKRSAFIATFKSGKRVIARRKTRKRLPLIVLYFLPTQTRVQPKLNFVPETERRAARDLSIFVAAGIGQALRTARP